MLPLRKCHSEQAGPDKLGGVAGVKSIGPQQPSGDSIGYAPFSFFDFSSTPLANFSL